APVKLANLKSLQLQRRSKIPKASARRLTAGDSQQLERKSRTRVLQVPLTLATECATARDKYRKTNGWSPRRPKVPNIATLPIAQTASACATSGLSRSQSRE